MAYSTSTIAKGCFGKVYKEKYNDTWAAVKRVPQNLICRRDLERECDVYNKACHPNIVKLLGNITHTDGKWVIPLEFIFGEDLETTIFQCQKSKIQLTPSNKATIILGMCEGLLFLHGKDIVHQDLKPENIMVEHGSNRAVIIDLGLAKFFRNGLSSAIDRGNEAYSAPEVLHRVHQRDQRSDVWALGKIIAELCVRVRLYTPSVCPAKIQETLPGQPYCQPVSRMVESDPSMRATMAGVISDIRRAGGGGFPSGGPTMGHLQTPSAHPYQSRRIPSPSERDRPPGPRPMPPAMAQKAQIRLPSPTSRLEGPPSPIPDTKLQRPQAPVPAAFALKAQERLSPPTSRWERSPCLKPEPKNPRPQAPAPAAFALKAQERLSPPTSRWEGSPCLKPEPKNPRPQAPVPAAFALKAQERLSPPTSRWEGSSCLKPEPKNPQPQAPVPAAFALKAHERLSPPTSRWEGSPCPIPETHLLHHLVPVQHPHSPWIKEVKNQFPQIKGTTELSHDILKMKLYQEATKDLPRGLPITGKVQIQSYEEKDGEIGSWEQKEVVTKGGRIVKFDDVRFINK